MRLPGESDEYRSARDALLEAEMELRRKIEAVAAQRRALPLGGEAPEDYAFTEEGGGSVRLSELFEPGKDTLFLYSFMFIPQGGDPLGVACPSCTSIIDAIDGAAPHIEQQVNFAVAAKAPIERFAAHGRARGWRNARLLSSAGSSYNRDYGSETEDEAQLPISTIFTRRDGRIHHFWSCEMFFAQNEPGQQPRHVDFMWPLWNVLDRTPQGRGEEWTPLLDYPA